MIKKRQELKQPMKNKHLGI